MNTAQTVWVILDHPWQLNLAQALRAGYTGTARWNAIVTDHKYWKSMEPKALESVFDEVHRFFEPTRAHSIKEMISFVRSCNRLKQAVKKLAVQPNDVFITLCYWKYLENIVTTVFPKNRSVFVVRHDVAKDYSRRVRDIMQDSETYIPKAGWVHFILLERILHLKKHTLWYQIRGEERHHGIAFSQPVANLYDQVIVLHPIFSELKQPTDAYYPYALLKTPSPTSEKKRLLFILSDYVRNDNYYQKISRVMQALRKRYEHQYTLEVRKHPNRPEEYKEVDMKGWTLNEDPGNHEQFFLRNADSIALVCSHITMALVYAINLGIPAYSYHRCFGFDKNFAAMFELVYSELPAEFFMHDFDAEPLPYHQRQVDNATIAKSLEILYTRI